MPVKKKRDYKKEYAATKGPGSKQIKNRAKRNAARRKAIREGKVKKGDGKHVDHIQPLAKGGSAKSSNTRVISAKANLKKQPKRGSRAKTNARTRKKKK